MKKLLTVFLCILMIAGVGTAIYFGIQYNKTRAEKEVLIQQNAALQGVIDAVGPTTTAYTVAAKVNSGSVVRTVDLTSITVPTSTITDATVMDVSEIEGMLYKVNINPGTTITKDLVMTDEYDETIYEQDMTFEFLPLGLKVGDYVDIRVTFPYGQTMYVMSHKRIEQVVQETCTVKVFLNTAQQLLWQSAMKDKALYKDNGLALYITKYVEPGVQNDTMAFYPVRQEMEAIVQLNPNVKNKAECINSTLRKQIDRMLESVEDTDKMILTVGVQSEASSIKQSASQYLESDNSGYSVGQDNDSEDIDSTILDLSEQQVSDSLHEIDSTLTTVTEPEDVAPAITNQQRKDAAGGNPQEGEAFTE